MLEKALVVTYIDPQDETIQLEGQLHQSTSDVGVIVCHPHPLYAGTMNNKVVTTLARAAQQQGLSSFRFNYRGVGNSTGKSTEEKPNGDYQVLSNTGGAVGELADTLAVIDYALQELGWKSVVLVGFSYGAGMASLAADMLPDSYQGRVKALFMIAPPVHHFEAPSQLSFEYESFVYMGDADEVVPFDEVEHWAQLVTPPPHFHVFEEASHFFHGRLTDLKKTFVEDLNQLDLTI